MMTRNQWQIKETLWTLTFLYDNQIQYKYLAKFNLKFGTEKGLYIRYNCGDNKYENLVELEIPDRQSSKIEEVSKKIIVLEPETIFGRCSIEYLS